MLLFNDRTHEIKETTGGYSNIGVPIKDTFVQLGGGMNFQRGMLYQPAEPGEKAKIGIVICHADADYSTWNICGELAKRGYTTLGSCVSDRASDMDKKLLDIRRCVEFLRAYPGVEKVVLMGHSGGATLMTAYQRIAENGVASVQGDDMLYKCTLREELPAADGVMTLDANFGNGSMTLLSIDPQIEDDNCGVKLDPEYDYFTKESGYAGNDTKYTPEFIDKYCAAQAKRNNAIIQKALDRLSAIENHEGNYIDDEPFNIAGANQIHPCNRLFPQDPHLFGRTKKEYDLIHADGSITHEIIHSLRNTHIDKSPTPIYGLSTVSGTVKTYLSEHAVMAKEDYRMYEDGVTGIDWDHTYNCPPGNSGHFTCPLLCMGMTGSYEFLAAEAIYQNAASKDKSIAFVEGATHNFNANTDVEKFPGQFGDTEKLLFDHVAEWLGAPGRFL